MTLLFVPHSEKDKQEMLEFLGLKSIDDLFADIDEKLVLKTPLNLPPSMSEIELTRHMLMLSEKNGEVLHKSCFIGAGAYNHFIPSVVNHIISRAEFYTSYTPYQPEVSQGILQAIFEYQTMIAELVDIEAVNASVYDGATALGEAVIMASNITGKKEIIISSSVHPEYKEVVKTYCSARELMLKEVKFCNGVTSLEDLEKVVSKNSAAVVVQNPTFFGCIENLSGIEKICHEKDILLIVSVVEPTSLGMLKPPGECGADIVTGEGQSFGNSLNYGGPYLGFVGTKNKYLRYIPGRLVGATTDMHGRRGYVLTLQAREQHIRREKAFSNICTNQALNALATVVYLSLLGRAGLVELANLCYQKAHYAYDAIAEINGFKPVFTSPFYNEFVFKCPISPRKINKQLLKHEIIGGFDVGRFYPELNNTMMFCVSERNSKADIDKLVEVLEKIA